MAGVARQSHDGTAPDGIVFAQRLEQARDLPVGLH